MPWSEGFDNLPRVTDAARPETDCETDHERSRTAVHFHRTESRAFDVLAPACVRVTLQPDCLHTGLDNVGPMA